MREKATVGTEGGMGGRLPGGVEPEWALEGKSKPRSRESVKHRTRGVLGKGKEAKGRLLASQRLLSNGLMLPKSWSCRLGKRQVKHALLLWDFTARAVDVYLLPMHLLTFTIIQVIICPELSVVGATRTIVLNSLWGL